LQAAKNIADVYVKNAGYNQVADVNNMIILYPQATSNLLANPNACWDW
jgi:poly(3-hydroxybutyrate) depolymerase